jgi:hypothetical protein
MSRTLEIALLINSIVSMLIHFFVYIRWLYKRSLPLERQAAIALHVKHRHTAPLRRCTTGDCFISR